MFATEAQIDQFVELLSTPTTLDIDALLAYAATLPTLDTDNSLAN